MTVDSKARVEPTSTLQAMDVHASWSRQFRSSENDRFYGLAFDYIAGEFGEPALAPVVDAGCGSATKSLHLAKRGFQVQALDFSEAILVEARRESEKAGLADRIEFAQADLTALTLPTAGARRVLCWGVLMHVPAVEKAVAELSRALAPGGTLIVSEGNKRSLQAWSFSALKRLLGRERAEIVHAPAGKEFWEETRTGKLMTRQADIPWLIAEFERHGLRLRERRAGQFTEIYMVLPWRPLRTLVHAFNNFWFRALPSFAGGAYGNILVFDRPARP
jgi:2-polyprenyl-3-methyl-5-hydroxy-6-metoxy-1,4-benzoquinol methylase